ncbi:DUF4296 domain-containing protein [Pontibacter sp. KCTC 32443]|nr:DUF4296 domain-containing protein [Pontibacter sp. KCTC 32443]MBC5773185.1 DUF4296 domain-containing protein [Pontibacter sp. KCTC 32443]
MIPQGKMVQILADVHTMESLIESNIPYPDTAVMVYNKQQKLILQKYGVTKERFHRTYEYYGKNLAEMDRLYEIILDTLTAREAKLSAKKEEILKDDDAAQIVDTLDGDVISERIKADTIVEEGQDPLRRLKRGPNRLRRLPVPAKDLQ